MPKILELTVQFDIQKVSCPGVWLCQDGRVSLTVSALGTSYQTCLLPPMFPLLFKDVFYFRKRYQETCALNNLCCLLQDETIYCELVQWSDDCTTGNCVVLAQYLGAVNDLLFPPNVCSSDGVDLLMRRAKEFPGILSPKIEVATKVRIDEVWSSECGTLNAVKMKPCHCGAIPDGTRQKQVCHSSDYHKNKCSSGGKRPPSLSRARPRSESSRSCCSLRKPAAVTCACPNPARSADVSSKLRRSRRRYREVDVYNVQVSNISPVGNSGSLENEIYSDLEIDDDDLLCSQSDNSLVSSKVRLESRYIDDDSPRFQPPVPSPVKHQPFRINPCLCDICKRYHELFHTNQVGS